MHIRTTYDKLRSLKKEFDKLIIDYLLHGKALADSLVAAGSSISDFDPIESLYWWSWHTWNSWPLCMLTKLLHLTSVIEPFKNIFYKIISPITFSTGVTQVAYHTPKTIDKTSGESPNFYQWGHERVWYQGRGVWSSPSNSKWRPPMDNQLSILPTLTYSSHSSVPASIKQVDNQQPLSPHLQTHLILWFQLPSTLLLHVKSATNMGIQQ